jgi:hypothetical protein
MRLLVVGLLAVLPLAADVRGCVCDASRPETMDARECSLSRVAISQPPEPQFFIIRDASPNKPNRWLAIPRFQRPGPQDLVGMTPEQRTAYWTLALGRARELWGEKGAVAVNSVLRRSQCQMHIHIGKLMDGAENEHFSVIDGPAQIPLPRENDGIWVHPSGGKLHIHWGDPAPELLLEH